MSTSASPWAGRRRSSTARADGPSSRRRGAPDVDRVGLAVFLAIGVQEQPPALRRRRGLREGAIRTALQPADLAPEGSHDPTPIRALDREQARVRGPPPLVDVVGGSVSGPSGVSNSASPFESVASEAAAVGSRDRRSRNRGGTCQVVHPHDRAGFRRRRVGREVADLEESTARCRSGAGSRRDRRRGRAGRGSPGQGVVERVSQRRLDGRDAVEPVGRNEPRAGRAEPAVGAGEPSRGGTWSRPGRAGGRSGRAVVGAGTPSRRFGRLDCAGRRSPGRTPAIAEAKSTRISRGPSAARSRSGSDAVRSDVVGAGRATPARTVTRYAVEGSSRSGRRPVFARAARTSGDLGLDGEVVGELADAVLVERDLDARGQRDTDVRVARDRADDVDRAANTERPGSGDRTIRSTQGEPVGVAGDQGADGRDRRCRRGGGRGNRERGLGRDFQPGRKLGRRFVGQAGQDERGSRRDPGVVSGGWLQRGGHVKRWQIQGAPLRGRLGGRLGGRPGGRNRRRPWQHGRVCLEDHACRERTSNKERDTHDARSAAPKDGARMRSPPWLSSWRLDRDGTVERRHHGRVATENVTAGASPPGHTAT